MDKKLIIKKIKQHYNFKSDAEFARFLGVNSQNIRNWTNRNNYNANLLIEKCTEISPTFIITGEGEFLRSELQNNTKESITLPIEAWRIIQTQVESLTIRDKQIEARDKQIDELIKLLKEQRKNDVHTDNVSCVDVG